MDIVFLIPTYGRQESCQKIVNILQGKGDIVVLGDCVDYTIDNCSFSNQTPHNGKVYYFETVNRLFSLRGKHKHYVMMPDDWIPRDNMVERAVELWEGIGDKRKVCLNILCPGTIGNINWTGFPAKDKGTVLKTQWVDGCFICDDTFFNAVGIIKNTHASRSSGVGAYISRKLHLSNYGMYMVKERLFDPDQSHFKSQMHDEKKIYRHSLNPRKRVFDTRGRR